MSQEGEARHGVRPDSVLAVTMGLQGLAGTVLEKAVWAIADVGRTPVYDADITAVEESRESPRGNFEILYRVYKETMSSEGFDIAPNEPGGWYYEDVYYTQYFNTEGDALHFNWRLEEWKFGEVRDSGGCIGLGWDDAQYF